MFVLECIKFLEHLFKLYVQNIFYFSVDVGTVCNKTKNRNLSDGECRSMKKKFVRNTLPLSTRNHTLQFSLDFVLFFAFTNPQTTSTAVAKKNISKVFPLLMYLRDHPYSFYNFGIFSSLFLPSNTHSSIYAPFFFLHCLFQNTRSKETNISK